MTSRVSAVMLARIGPVKSFFMQPLITHNEACSRTDDTALAAARSRSEAGAAWTGIRGRT
jgi:hypothetical protein